MDANMLGWYFSVYRFPFLQLSISAVLTSLLQKNRAGSGEHGIVLHLFQHGLEH